MSFIIAIANEKGGVAKTTSAASLGCALADAGHKTLLIDLDAQGSLSLALGVDPMRLSFSSSDVLLKKSRQFDVVADVAGVDGLDLSPANRDILLIEKFLPSQHSGEFTVSNALRLYHPGYDFVLMDCPPTPGIINQNALIAANLVIIPTLPEYLSVLCLRNLMTVLRQVKAEYNQTLAHRLLFTLFDRRNRLHPMFSEQARNTFKGSVFETIIPIDTKVRESSVKGRPVLRTAPKSRAAEAYRALADEVMAYAQG